MEEQDVPALEERRSKMKATKMEPPKEKKVNKIPKQVQANNLKKVLKRKHEDSAYYEAANLWIEEKKKGNKKRKLCAQIVREVNKKYNTNILDQTVCKRVALGKEKEAPHKGRKTKLGLEVDAAIKSALKTYIQLENAGMKKNLNNSN